MDNEDKVFGLVDEWARRFEGNVLQGIAELNETYKDDRMTSKALLTLIALAYPEYAEPILGYLKVYFYVSENEKKKSGDEIPFNLIKELTYTQLTTVSLLLERGETKQAGGHIDEMIEQLSDFKHSMEITTLKTEAQVINELSGNIEQSIKASKKHLDRLADFVIVANQDKILNEMIAFKRALATLEERVQNFIVNKF